MKKRDVDYKELMSTVLLYVVTMLLLILVVCTDAFLESQANKDGEPAPAMLSFLSEFIPSQSPVEQEAALERYFSCVDTANRSVEGLTQDYTNIAAALLTPGVAAQDFRVCISKKNYLEIMLLGPEGEDLPPRVGIFYRVNGEGFISSYSFTRLQPVSRSDAEWSEVWQ